MKHHILMIGATPENRAVLSEALEDRYTFQHLSSVHDLVDVSQHPGVVLLDMAQPDIVALRIFKSEQHWCCAGIPVILIVSENTLEFERAARNLGVFYFLVRPFDLSELSEALKSATGLPAGNPGVRA